jgi:hypothetical protein
MPKGSEAPIDTARALLANVRAETEMTLGLALKLRESFERAKTIRALASSGAAGPTWNLRTILSNP